jgi:hypothetical protein
MMDTGEIVEKLARKAVILTQNGGELWTKHI